MTFLVGLDIGTTNIKAALYDAELGQVVSVASRPTPVEHPAPGWSEHDPETL
ncbi:MAG: FGGY family carbohydrate kinase [Anaerolineae bacterium]